MRGMFSKYKNQVGVKRVYMFSFQFLLLSFLTFLSNGCGANDQGSQKESIHEKSEQPGEQQVNKEKVPGIVLLNIGDYDREYIGTLVHMVDSCKPAAIIINVLFKQPKEGVEDAVLCKALRESKVDFLVSNKDKKGNVYRSAPKFDTLATAVGLPYPDEIDGVATHFTPFKKVNSIIQKHIAIEVIEKIRPGIKWKYAVDESVPIKYTKALPDIENYKIMDLDPEYFDNSYQGKIVILTYLGPALDNVYYTPLRKGKEYGNIPDTYGGVVLANIFGTIFGN